MVAADSLFFRDAIPASIVELTAKTSAFQRIVLFTPFAIADDLIFRLGAMSAVSWVLVLIAGKRDWCFWAAILVTALIIYPLAHYSYLAGLEPSLASVMREIMLHGGAGILWGYLYWRFGLLAAICGHVGAHLVLEPLMSLLI